MTDNAVHWEHFDHGADIGIRGTGDSVGSAFEQAALAMTAVVCNPDTVRPLESIDIECEASDIELLFIDWLNCLVYEMATRKMLFSEFSVDITGDKLTAIIRGEAIDIERHQPAVEIKGATLTALKVKQTEQDQWVAETVVDV